MNKKSLFLPVMSLCTAGLAYAYLSSTKVSKPDISLLEEPANKKKLSIFRLKRKTTKVSRSLLKILNNIDNNRLLFIEINTKSKKSRENILVQLEGLKTDLPVDDMWIADFYKQTFSRDDIIALTNKKAIFYLSNLEEVTKVKISARTTVLKMVGNSLSILSTKYPSLERYFFEPMLDIYAPLKETDGLNNLGTVAYAQLYRGGMPVGEHNYDILADLGIKTVINLKIEDSAVEYVGEQNNLLKREIGLHYIPLPNVAAPTMQQAMEFLTIVYNTDMKPVFVHCHRGSDRTGIMAAVFRITQGYSASWALVEAEKYNIAASFHHYKIEFVYDFEKNWIKWTSEVKIPNDLTNFDFINLMSIEENNDSEDTNTNIEITAKIE
ncbi:MAG: tyrosine-protein phosphatase [Candidatus Sericytochromatia bacterium]|nr:tyrosine-protein phosphatase [Candidatus Sericytochromatia bacterium]